MAHKDPSGFSRPSAIASGRLGPVIRGYAAACLLAAVVLPFGLILQDLFTGRLGSLHVSEIFLVSAGLFLVTFIAAAPFATAFIVLSETMGIRSIAACAAFGALTGVMVEVIFRIFRSGPGPAGSFWSLLLTVGLVGAASGVVYWIIALRGHVPAVQTSR